jgi:hypothetical protein
MQAVVVVGVVDLPVFLLLVLVHKEEAQAVPSYLVCCRCHSSRGVVGAQQPPSLFLG